MLSEQSVYFTARLPSLADDSVGYPISGLRCAVRLPWISDEDQDDAKVATYEHQSPVQISESLVREFGKYISALRIARADCCAGHG